LKEVDLVLCMTACHYRDLDIVTRAFEPLINFDIAILFPANRPRSKRASEFAQAVKKGMQKFPVEN